mmetsp:Transcript_30658/g.56018  ORF Transcript_30658/g.56018 Transcript_30658/m.56018 type:complete len:527 (+) Transcript_30658:91-1671(+)
MGDCIVCGTTADKESKKTVQETKQVWCETSKDNRATPDVQKTWREPKDQGTDAASTERHKAGSGQLRSTAAREGDGPTLPTVAESDSPSLKTPAATQLAKSQVNGDTGSSRASSPRQTPPSPAPNKTKKPSRSSRNTLSGYMSWKECSLADLADLFPEYYSLEGANTPWGFTPPLTTMYHGREEENQPDGFERLQEMLASSMVDEDGREENRQSFHSVVILRHDSGDVQDSPAVEERGSFPKQYHHGHRQARIPSIRTALTEAMLKDMRAHSPSPHWHSGSASRMPSNNSSNRSRRPSLGQDHSTDALPNGLLEVKMQKRSSERRSVHDVGQSPASRSRQIERLSEEPSSVGRKGDEMPSQRKSERTLQRMMSYDSTESLPGPRNRSVQSDAGKAMHPTLSVRRPSQGDVHGTSVRISRMWSATDEQIVNTLKAHCTDSNKLRDAQELEESGSDGEASHSVSHSRQRSWNSGSMSTDSDEPFDLPAWLEQDTHQNHAGEKRALSREASSFGSSSGFSREESDSSGL